MTTLVLLRTKDAVVLGCDSLATTMAPLISPDDLGRIGDDMKDPEDPKISISYKKLNQISKMYPMDHMTHVDKLFSLAPLNMGVMITGISGLGNRTIKNLISEFIHCNFGFVSMEEASYASIGDVVAKLGSFMLGYYRKDFPDEKLYQPPLEFIFAGYSKNERISFCARISFPEGVIEPIGDEFGIMLGGSYDAIQSIIFGADNNNRYLVEYKHREKLYEYYDILTEHLAGQGLTVALPKPDDYKQQLEIFSDGWTLNGFIADWGDFSDQNAIECVRWLIEIMGKSHQFGSRLPTVGGEVNLAIITEKDGFRYVSKREYQVDGYSVPRDRRG